MTASCPARFPQLRPGGYPFQRSLFELAVHILRVWVIKPKKTRPILVLLAFIPHLYNVVQARNDFTKLEKIEKGIDFGARRTFAENHIAPARNTPHDVRIWIDDCLLPEKKTELVLETTDQKPHT